MDSKLSVQSAISTGLPPDDSAGNDVSVEKYTRKPHVAFVDSDRFAILMGIIVSINVITIGAETDAPKKGDSAQVFGIINNGLLLAYIIELMLRLLTHGLPALKDPFTLMDVVLVLLAFLERVVGSGGFARALPVFRLLRVIRLLRASKYFRHSHELAVIAAAGSRVMKTLGWVVLFLFLIVWSVACLAHVAIGESAEWNETMDPTKTLPAFRAFDVREYFGSMMRSFFTMMQVVTVSQWAPHVARPVVQVYPITVLFFVCFVLVVTYGVVITIVSNLVQDSMSAARDNEKALKEMALESRRTIGNQAKDILAEVDKDGSGELSEEEIAYALKVTNLGEILVSLGVPVLDAESLVRLLDKNGNGEVSFEELVDGITVMGEDIKPRDYQFLAFWVWNLLMRTKSLEERLDNLVDKIGDIRRRLQGSFGALQHLIRTHKASSLRRRALHVIRTTGPQLPPPLTLKKRPEPKYKAQDQFTEFLSFARRFLAERKPRTFGTDASGWRPSSSPTRARHPASPSEGRSNQESEEDARSQALRHTGTARETLPPAPMPFHKEKRQAKRLQPTLDGDRYAMVNGHHENPNLKALKGVLGSM